MPASSPNSHYRLQATETTVEKVNSDIIEANNKLLDQALASNQESAQLLLSKIGEFRQNKDEEGFDTILNNLLESIESSPTKPLPWWTKYRTTAKFSKRARKASLDRVIELSSLTEEIENKDDVLSNQSRRRRSLLLLLRSLANSDSEDKNSSPKRISISKLEKIAIKEAKKRMTPEDILGRVPEGLESPTYKVIKSDYSTPSFYEIRQYDPFSTCTVEMSTAKPSSSSTPAAAGSAFNSLAGYLFGKNQSSQKMSMTTPVFTSSSPGNDSKQMSFVLPSEYWTKLENAPKPMESKSNDDKGVMLIQEEAQTRAVLLFGGFASKKEVETQKEELLNKINGDPDFKLASDQKTQDIRLAQYNDPFTPPWKRRNEVSVLVSQNKN